MTRAVLTFHSVDDSGSVLSYPIAAFRLLVERLAATGTPVVEFSELLNRDHGVTITFDDGMRTVHQNALPVLQRYGFPAHLFLTTGRVGKDIGWPSQRPDIEKFEMLHWHEVEECASKGLLIECHTVSHPDLRSLSSTQIVDECASADNVIEEHVGRRPSLFAFPFGLFNDAVRQTLAPLYKGCFTTRLGYLQPSCDLSRVHRLDSYYLQAPIWYGRLFSAATRSYIGGRALIRAVRGVT